MNIKCDRRWQKILLAITIAIIVIIGAKIPLKSANSNVLGSAQAEGLCSESNSEPCKPRLPLEGPDGSSPSLAIHPLPKSLALWQDKLNLGDYFNVVKATPLGYLIWSQFPVKVYFKIPTADSAAANLRWQEWEKIVDRAIAEWNVYLPLVKVSDRQSADIIILPSEPKRKIQLNPETGLYDIPRAIAARTNYQFYLRDNPPILAHRMTIQLPPNSTGESLLATIRHEMGHALGIWGHSPVITDALYFSQVANPQPISARDINTLQKIYRQPTRLGWKITRK